MIKTTVKEADLFKHKTQCLIFLCREEKKPSKILPRIDKELNGAISSCYQDKRFEGKLNQKLWLNAGGGLMAENILLVGVGKAKEISEDRLRQAGGSAARLAEKNNLDYERLPISDSFLKWLKIQAENNRDIYLVTGAPLKIAVNVAERVGIFKGVMGTTPEVNLSGKNKADLCILGMKINSVHPARVFVLLKGGVG